MSTSIEHRSPATPSAQTPPRRVFLLEDESIIALLMEDMLQELGYEVCDSVGDLDRAAACARTTQADMAILDVNVHGQASYGVADVLKDRGIPVVFLTGYGRQGLAPEYRTTAVLMKPVSITSLGDTLQALRC